MDHPTGEEIIIIGAGILGLDVAYVLAIRGFAAQVTVIAEHMPGDRAPDYASPTAAASFHANSSNRSNVMKWERLGYEHFTDITDEFEEECGVNRTVSTELFDGIPNPKKLLDQATYFRQLIIEAASNLPYEAQYAMRYVSFTINPEKHLVFLRDLLKDGYGVKFVDKKLSDLSDAVVSDKTQMIFNCTGLGARTLGGVLDFGVVSLRSQAVLVKAPEIKCSLHLHEEDGHTYIIPRPGTDGHVVLGGTLSFSNNPNCYFMETEEIYERCLALSRILTNNPPDIIDSWTGITSFRWGGPCN